MLRVAHGAQLIWYDVEKPTQKDIVKLKEELRIHPLVLDELIPQVRHPKLDLFGSHIFLVLTVPLIEQEKGKKKHFVSLEELDIIFGKTWIVTSHYRPFTIINTLFERLEQERKMHAEYLDNENPATLLYTIISTILQEAITSLGSIEELVDRAERAIAGGKDRQMIQELSELRRDIIDFRRAFSPARPVFRALDDAGPALLGADSFPYFRNLTGRIEQIATILTTLKEATESLEETTHSLLTTHTNDIVRLFTVLTALLLPPSLVTSIFSMNLKYPFNIDVNAFWWVNGIALATIILPLIIFKKRHWL